MIKIIQVGKIRSNELKSLISYYEKQIPRKVEIIEVRDVATIDKIKEEEVAILKNINSNDYVVTLEILGKMMTSEEFSKFINKIETVERKDIVFVIGGSYGLTENVSKRANYKLSFSKFTFPHQLMHLILMEQIYRGYSIISNHPYHK